MARVKWCMQDLVVVLPDICGGYGIGRNSRIAVLSAPGSSDSEPDCHFHPKARALSIAGDHQRYRDASQTGQMLREDTGRAAMRGLPPDKEPE